MVKVDRNVDIMEFGDKDSIEGGIYKCFDFQTANIQGLKKIKHVAQEKQQLQQLKTVSTSESSSTSGILYCMTM